MYIHRLCYCVIREDLERAINTIVEMNGLNARESVFARERVEYEFPDRLYCNVLLIEADFGANISSSLAVY